MFAIKEDGSKYSYGDGRVRAEPQVDIFFLLHQNIKKTDDENLPSLFFLINGDEILVIQLLQHRNINEEVRQILALIDASIFSSIFKINLISP